MRRFIPPAWFLSALLVVALIGAFAYADKTRLHWYAEEPSVAAAPTAATVERDSVVGVALRCSRTGTQYRTAAEYTGDICLGNPNAWQEVTVRTAQGTTYSVKANASQLIRVGQIWPP